MDVGYQLIQDLVERRLAVTTYADHQCTPVHTLDAEYATGQLTQCLHSRVIEPHQVGQIVLHGITTRL